VLDACERAVRARPEVEVVSVERRLWKGSDDSDGDAGESPAHDEEVWHG
jgi:hypothetical protein